MMSRTLMLLAMSTAQATDPLKAGVRVPSIEEVVVKEGFTPTPSQSDIYRPGAVLVPNDRGGHDMVVENCVSVEPTISLMSQSSIATSLSAGVTARLAVARGEVASGVERRLSFVDPEQRTLPLGRLTPTDACVREVRSAGRIQPLTGAFIVQDVLVAQIKNTVCTRADASGRITVLGEAEAAAYSECIQESDGQVPLGYKSVPWTSLSAAPSPMAAASVNSGVTFDVPDLGVDAMLKQQACQAAADKTAAIQREARMSALVADAKTKAADAWAKISPQAEKCASLQGVEQRAPCTQAVEGWLAKASSMQITLPAGVERVTTECGEVDVAFPAQSKQVRAADVDAAENVKNTLNQNPLSNYAIGCGDSLGPTVRQAMTQLEEKLVRCWEDKRDPIDGGRGKTVLLQLTYETSGKLTRPNAQVVLGNTDDRLKSCFELAIVSSQYSKICEQVEVEKTLKFGTHAP